MSERTLDRLRPLVLAAYWKTATPREELLVICLMLLVGLPDPYAWSPK